MLFNIPRFVAQVENNTVLDGFIEYALPLIQGEVNIPREDGLPRYAKLKKIVEQ